MQHGVVKLSDACKLLVLHQQSVATTPVLNLRLLERRFNLPKRRLYDLLHILGALSITSWQGVEKGNDCFRWNGLTEAASLIAGWEKPKKVEEEWKGPAPCSPRAQAPILHRLTHEFVKLLLFKAPEKVTLEEAAAILVIKGDLVDSTKSKILRRLYDVVAVLESIEFIRKSKKQGSSANLWCWAGCPTGDHAATPIKPPPPSAAPPSSKFVRRSQRPKRSRKIFGAHPPPKIKQRPTTGLDLLLSAVTALDPPRPVSPDTSLEMPTEEHPMTMQGTVAVCQTEQPAIVPPVSTRALRVFLTASGVRPGG